MVRFTNLEIIKILMEDSRKPYTEIAKILKVSEAAVRKRIKKLESEGVIKKYTIEVDLKKLGYDIHAFIGMDTSPEKFIDTVEMLRTMDEVVSLYTSSGDHMIMLECWFKESKELTKFLERLKKINGVTKICPAIVMEKVK